MIRCLCMIANLLFLFSQTNGEANSSEEKKPSPSDIRRFANVVEWALQGSDANNSLIKRTHQIAAQTDLPNDVTQKLIGSTSRIVKSFVREKAMDWATRTDKAKVSDEAALMKKSVGPILLSKSYKKVLGEVLDPDQEKKWLIVAREFANAELREISARRRLGKARQKALFESRAEVDARIRVLARKLIAAELVGESDRAAYHKEVGELIQGLVDSSKEATKLYYGYQVELINQKCELSEKQIRKLTLAAKGISVRTHRSVAEEFSVAKSKRLGHEQATAIMNIARSSTFKATRLDPVFWSGALEKTLTAEQQKAWTTRSDKEHETSIWVP